jgi:nuclear transport factor 2 (NTF2) superfamily protein
VTDRPPLPPFTRETALRKVQAAEDAWNTRDPERVAAAYTVDSVWRGLMRRREASINDVPIGEAERRIFGPRPDSERGTEFPLR